MSTFFGRKNLVFKIYFAIYHNLSGLFGDILCVLHKAIHFFCIFSPLKSVKKRVFQKVFFLIIIYPSKMPFFSTKNEKLTTLIFCLFFLSCPSRQIPLLFPTAAQSHPKIPIFPVRRRKTIILTITCVRIL